MRTIDITIRIGYFRALADIFRLACSNVFIFPRAGDAFPLTTYPSKCINRHQFMSFVILIERIMPKLGFDLVSFIKDIGLEPES